MADDLYPLEGDYGTAAWMRSHATELGPLAVPSLRRIACDGAVPMRALALEALSIVDPDGSEAFVLERLAAERDGEVRAAGTRGLAHARGNASFAWLASTDAPDREATIALQTRLSGASPAELRTLAEQGPARPTEVCVRLAAANADDLGWIAALAGTDDAPRCAWLSAATCHALGRNANAAAAARILELVATHGKGEEERIAACEALVVCGARMDAIAEGLVTRWLAGEPCTLERGLALARVAVERAPARAFELLSPDVGAAHLERAAPILEALVAQLRDAYAVQGEWERGAFGPGLVAPDPMTPRGRTPDARWRQIVGPPPRIELDSAMDDRATLAMGLAWAAGTWLREGPRWVECGAEDGIPLVVAGFDLGPLEHQTRKELVAHLSDVPAFRALHYVEHQCDGYACAQAPLLGIPLSSARLALELSPTSSAVDQLYAHTQGWEPFTATTLPLAHRLLSTIVSGLPPLVRGVEAFVSTGPCELQSATRDLEVVEVLGTQDPWLRRATWWDVVLQPVGAFGASHDELLRDVGERLGLGRPSMHVLWANTD